MERGPEHAPLEITGVKGNKGVNGSKGDKGVRMVIACGNRKEEEKCI